MRLVSADSAYAVRCDGALQAVGWLVNGYFDAIPDGIHGAGWVVHFQQTSLIQPTTNFYQILQAVFEDIWLYREHDTGTPIFVNVHQDSSLQVSQIAVHRLAPLISECLGDGAPGAGGLVETVAYDALRQLFQAFFTHAFQCGDHAGLVFLGYVFALHDLRLDQVADGVGVKADGDGAEDGREAAIVLKEVQSFGCDPSLYNPGGSIGAWPIRVCPELYQAVSCEIMKVLGVSLVYTIVGNPAGYEFSSRGVARIVPTKVNQKYSLLFSIKKHDTLLPEGGVYG